MKLNIPSSTTKITSNFLEKKSIELFIKRDDQIHEVVSGNKWRKLKYNFQEAHHQGYEKLLSFGGRHSNHLHALSYAAHSLGFQSIGVVRGANKNVDSPTLLFCESNNMKLHYIDKELYRFHKYDESFLTSLRNVFGDFYLIPEGGSNVFGIKGCKEIMNEMNFDFDYICCAVGTGCTAAGLIQAKKMNQKFLGFCPFVKVEEQKSTILSHFQSAYYNDWEIIPDNHFGGFGKINSNLIKFIQQFYDDFNIKLDLVYMGKLFYHLFDLIDKDFFSKKTRIIVVHSGGLQGLSGFNFKYS